MQRSQVFESFRNQKTCSLPIHNHIDKPILAKWLKLHFFFAVIHHHIIAAGLQQLQAAAGSDISAIIHCFTDINEHQITWYRMFLNFAAIGIRVP